MFAFIFANAGSYSNGGSFNTAGSRLLPLRFRPNAGAPAHGCQSGDASYIF